MNMAQSGFVSIPSSNLLTINASTSSSSSSSAPSSSSLNDNSTRIRHFSENDSNEATGLLLTGNTINPSSYNRPTLSNSLDKKANLNFSGTRNQLNYFSNNNLLSALNNEHNFMDMDFDYTLWTNNHNKFEDEEGISTLINGRGTFRFCSDKV
jgi:hypothetical protein